MEGLRGPTPSIAATTAAQVEASKPAATSLQDHHPNGKDIELDESEAAVSSSSISGTTIPDVAIVLVHKTSTELS